MKWSLSRSARQSTRFNHLRHFPNLERLEPRIAMDGTGIVETDVVGGSENARDIALQADGKIMAVGWADTDPRKNTTNYDGVLIRYNADGSLDTSFSGDGIQTTNVLGSSDVFWEVAAQQDQKVVAMGHARGSGKNAYDNMAVVRYLPDGSLDSTFSGDGKAFADFGALAQVFAGAIQPDGKIVVAGRAFLSPTRFAVARFNPDGSLDSSFGSGGKVTTDLGIGVSHEVDDLVVQPDGRIVVAGAGGGYFLLARYNANGSLDTSFDGDGKLVHNIGLSAGGISDLALQPDGRIIAAGGGTVGLVARYNPGGSLDSSFGTSGVFQHPSISSYINGVDLLSDGRIVLSGGRDWRASRLNADGSLDTTFSGTGSVLVVPSAAAFSLLVQPDDKIVMVGNDATPGSSGPGTKFINARLNSDGTFDATWGGGAAASESSSSLATAPPPAGANTSVSALDAASVQQLLAQPESTLTRKSRIKLLAL
jgi:uncharacterized delta-60 repeat protein